MHDFKYEYLYKNNLLTNQLASIPNYGSYQYDKIGQLEHEQFVGKPDRYYSYEVSGKVSGLYADANKTQPKVQFGYDAIGQRLYKYSSDNQLTTYYVRDASGNVLAIYEKTGNTNPIQQEIPIYGSGRLGTLNVLARSYVYELRDHLGNVRVVVGKVNGSLDIFSQSDYYALGSVLRRSGRDYRYGYQGMYAEEDKETGKNSFELRMYDAVIGRWLTTDPKRQYASPYEAMGNNWVSMVDPDGGTDGGCEGCPNGKENGEVRQHNGQSFMWSEYGWIGHADPDQGQDYTPNNWIGGRGPASIMGLHDSYIRLSYYKPGVEELKRLYETGRISDKVYSMLRYQLQKATKMQLWSTTSKVLSESPPFGKTLEAQRNLAYSVNYEGRPLPGGALKTRAATTNLARGGMVVGTVGTVFAVYQTSHHIITAQDKSLAVSQEAGGWALSLAGAEGGAILGAKIGGGIGMFFVGVGAPVGAAIGGFAGGVIGGYYGYKYGYAAGGAIHDSF